MPAPGSQAAEATRRPVPPEGMPYELDAGHRAELATVAAVGAVVAHHEVRAGRHVIRLLERPGKPVGEGVGGLLAAADPPHVGLVELDPVDVDIAVAQRDNVPRHAYDALDEHGAAGERGRRMKDGDLAALGLREAPGDAIHQTRSPMRSVFSIDSEGMRYG